MDNAAESRKKEGLIFSPLQKQQEAQTYLELGEGGKKVALLI